MLDNSFIKCKCGCNNLRTKYDKKNRLRKFIKGHQIRIRNPVWDIRVRRKISKSIKELNIKGKNHPQYKERLKIHCINCSNEFYVRPNKREQRLCGMKCRGEWMSYNYIGEGNPSFKNGKVDISCAYCRVEKLVLHIYKNGKRFCDAGCRGKYYSGKRNHNYIDGRSHEPYPPEFSRRLKKKILRIHGKKCHYPRCNKAARARIAIHHIDYNKHNNLEKNLIPLCTGHNSIVNHGRKIWQQYFELMKEKKLIMK